VPERCRIKITSLYRFSGPHGLKTKLKDLSSGYCSDGPDILSRAGFRGHDCYVFAIDMILPERMNKKVAIIQCITEVYYFIRTVLPNENYGN